MNFNEAATDYNNNIMTTTENGMPAHTTSASALVDLFNIIGSSRGTDITKSFYAALAADEDKAVRILLWSRDILQGAGEREQFKKLLQKLETYDYKLAARLIPKIPELGRWDDLFAYSNPVNISNMLDFYTNALLNKNALAAKWAPREKSAKRDIAYALRKHLGMQPKEYRKLLSENTDVVETKMCSNHWSEINFSHVPAKAANIYQAAFLRQAPTEYTTYLNAIESGDLIDGVKVKVNAKTLYPHDVIMSLLRGHDKVAYAQWDALPNYMGDAKILPMVDVSGSMGEICCVDTLNPIHVAVSLGLYISDKTQGIFKDTFLTFSENPEVVLIKGDLKLKLGQMSNANWGYNTNITKALSLILDIATSNRLSNDDMPDYLLILSDMEFDEDRHMCSQNIIDAIKLKYQTAKYKLPTIVFWNLSNDTKHAAAKFNSNGVAMISGFSPAIMTRILASDKDGFTPESIMLDTIMSNRYNF